MLIYCVLPIVLEIDVKITHATSRSNKNNVNHVLPVVITVDEVLVATVGVRVTPNDKIK